MGTAVKPSQERSRRRREALLDAAIEVFAEGGARAVTELEELAVAVASGGRNAEEIGRRFTERLVERRSDVIVAQFELYLEAARNPALREPVARALAAFERLAGAVLEFLGARDPDIVAASLVAVIDGFALHRVAHPRPRDVEIASLLDAMQALLIYHVMSDDERDRWHQRFQTPLTGIDLE